MSLTNNRDRLVKTARRGGITLVVGAGISRDFGVPNWENLAMRVWEATFPGKKSPWDAPDDKSPRSFPQFLPIVFEMALQELGRERFIETLHDCLYKNLRVSGVHQWTRSLEVLADLIVREHRTRGKRRLLRVISFNVDDLLERAVSARRDKSGKQASEGFARAGRFPRWDRGDEPIPIYHLHGWIVRGSRRSKNVPWAKNYDHMLVFADSQYWNSNSKVLSHANRIIGFALHDSHCVFVGISMTDINLLRWLALSRNELVDEFEQIERRYRADREDRIPPDYRPLQPPGMNRHFWIRPASDDPTGFLTEFLKTRGVLSVGLRSWSGRSFENLIAECFPPDD
ncbi:MAG: hypothetical protein E3J30_11915 [Anaerolineales bacterium]|nr:MAG: hypothetical protein E3J30_11915 [Anaerolineales bacterium]